MSDESARTRAERLLHDAEDYMPKSDVPERDDEGPTAYSQALATAGLGMAILALCDELRAQHTV